MIRKNPPLDDAQIDDPAPKGGECTIFSFAAATGRSVPEVRRAALSGGFDIWDERRDTSKWLKLLQALDLQHRIDTVGYSCARGMSGLMSNWLEREGFAEIEQMSQKKRGVDFRVSDCIDLSVAAVVAYCRHKNLAMIGITTHGARVRRSKGGSRHVSTHMVGYSPKMGFYDTMNTRRYVARGVNGDGGVEELPRDRWASHGEKIPEPRRRLSMWITFRGE